jgi:hypothetical protein
VPRHHGLNKQPAGKPGLNMHTQAQTYAKWPDSQHDHAKSSTTAVTGAECQMYEGQNEHPMQLLLCCTQHTALPATHMNAGNPHLLKYTLCGMLMHAQHSCADATTTCNGMLQCRRRIAWL